VFQRGADGWEKKPPSLEGGRESVGGVQHPLKLVFTIWGIHPIWLFDHFANLNRIACA
jgi:hypothetical protein